MKGQGTGTVRRTYKIIGVSLLAVVLVGGSYVGYRVRREMRLERFCEEVHAGMLLSEFLALETTRGIDASYLVAANRGDFSRQIDVRQLAFRSNPSDADWGECAIVHNGTVITSAGWLVF